jgi:hypothetical protein
MWIAIGTAIGFVAGLGLGYIFHRCEIFDLIDWFRNGA